MRGIVLVDTGPLYALRDPSDEHHIRATREIEQLERVRLRVAVLYPTLLECHRLMLGRLGIAESHAFLTSTEQTAFFENPDSDDYRNAIARIARFGDQAITLADALLAEVSLRLGVPVWTFDHHFDVMRVPVWRG